MPQSEKTSSFSSGPGWHTVAGRGTPAIETWLAEHHPEQAHIPEAGLVHRLDRGTSGCLLVATTLEWNQGNQAP